MTYLGEILQAIHEDGLPIGGIFAWGESSLQMLERYLR